MDLVLSLSSQKLQQVIVLWASGEAGPHEEKASLSVPVDIFAEA